MAGAMHQVKLHKVRDGQELGARPRKAVIALGGNALLQRGQPLTMENQMENAKRAAAALASLVREEGVALCVTHGNGPQVGLLAELDPDTSLDVVGAESEGQVGYVVELQLQEKLRGEQVVALLTRTLVDSGDPAFNNPSKFIGRMYSQQAADRLQHEKGWVMKPDGDKGWRRVVGSPRPLAIQEAPSVQLLMDNKVITVCCGGGGVPVAEQADGSLTGVEAVVDKDAASALLARNISADILLLLTDATAVFDPRRWPAEKVPLPSPISVDELERMEFAAGSMGPKVQAAVEYVKATGGVAGIGGLDDALDILRGHKGTIIAPGHMANEPAQEVTAQAVGA